MLVECLPFMDPLQVAARLQGEDGFLWFDSASRQHPAAQMTYICIWPVSQLSLQSGTEPLGQLRNWLQAYRMPRLADGPAFQGGAAGYIAYDHAPAFLDRFASRHDGRAPVMEFGLYDMVLAFDHAKQELAIFSTGLAGPETDPDEELARQKLNRLKTILEQDAPPLPAALPMHWTQATSADRYLESVRATQEFIRDGDIYQANISGLWTAAALTRRDAFAQYLEMRSRSPAPFSAFGAFPGRVIASASPERLVSADSRGKVRAEPIKGTARRGENEIEDAVLREALLVSEKDRAENVMIVDLLRNDLSRVCEPASVQVPSLCRLETFANLHHLVSTVEGQLAPGRDAVDLLSAVFPGGSITGAPKLRAMEIIDQLEPAARGVFCGSLGWIGFDGALDFSILIRTMDVGPSSTRLWAGAGITLLSDPQAEYEEIRLKAERIMVPAGATAVTP